MSLPPSDHPDLLAIRRTRYRTVDGDRFPGLTHVDTTVTALGVTRRVVLTHSKTLHAAQSPGFDQTLAKAQQRLDALADKLARGKTRRCRTAVQAEIDTVCKPRWVSEVMTITLTGQQPADLRLSFTVDAAASKALETRLFGKRILFTNRDTWPAAEVVAAHRSQAEAEAGFRQLKDPHVVSFSPMHHWTDQKIPLANSRKRGWEAEPCGRVRLPGDHRRVGKGGVPMGRVAVIGDVGGHPDQLRKALSYLGAHGQALRLPEDLTIVQVGDLIDRGPDSAAVLDLVGGYLNEQPHRWVQLIGNHEAQYLPGGAAFWRERLADHDAGRLRSWWGEERMQVAAAVRTVSGDEILLTHAGLTVDAWRKLGEPMTATTAALRLNERPEPLIWLGDGFVSDTVAGPLWAEAGSELYGPWMQFYAEGGYVPFDQVHGHSSVVSFHDQSWRCPGRVRQRATVDWQARQVKVRIGGRSFTGVDPKHGRTGAPRWQPLVLDDSDVVVGVAPVGSAPQS